MILSEPNPTKFDVHFRVGKIPVRIHPMFWLLTLILGAVTAQGQPPAVMVTTILLWVAAVFISILVHELGHALTAKAYGYPPRIILHGMGGLAAFVPDRRLTRRAKILIDFMGPGAGFILGGVILAAILLTGHSVAIPGLPIEIGNGESFTAGGGRLELFVMFMLYVNIFWGLLNLAPILPLDGGHITQAVIQKYRPRDGLRLSIQVSIVFAGVVAVAALFAWNSLFMAMLFGMLGFNNFQLLQQLKAQGY